MLASEYAHEMRDVVREAQSKHHEGDCSDDASNGLVTVVHSLLLMSK